MILQNLWKKFSDSVLINISPLNILATVFTWKISSKLFLILAFMSINLFFHQKIVFEFSPNEY